MSDKYKRNTTTEIRRAELNEESDKRLFELSNVEYGGSFEKHLKVLEGLGALKCVKKRKKYTVIIPDMKKVDSLLLNQQLKGSINNLPTTIQEKIEDNVWEEIIADEFNTAYDEKVDEIMQKLDTVLPLSDKTKRLQSHLFLKEAATRIAPHISSRLLEFYIQHEDKNFHLDKDIMKDLVMISRKIAKGNTRAPFNVVIEYKGIPESGSEFGHIVGPAILKIMGENFEKWATTVLHIDFNEEDKKRLQDGRFDLLSTMGKAFYDEIYFPLLEYYANLFNK